MFFAVLLFEQHSEQRFFCLSLLRFSSAITKDIELKSTMLPQAKVARLRDGRSPTS
jgi:hypothetical protein